MNNRLPPLPSPRPDIAPDIDDDSKTDPRIAVVFRRHEKKLAKKLTWRSSIIAAQLQSIASLLSNGASHHGP